MHGHSPAFTVLVNAEVDSMGGVVDGGTSIGTKTSPRQQAIEKVQAELRQEYDIREERKRELEFLEQGGNPLDFKFSSPASLSVQSTSLADQLHESEQKCNIALAGDSSESSKQIGCHFRSEPNIADNLFLLDGETSAFSGGRNGVRTGKRRKDTAVERNKKTEECSSVKELDDSSLLHHGPRSHAYARRKRDPQHRDGLQGSSVDDDHRSSVIPTSQPHPSSIKVSSPGTLVDNHAVHKLDKCASSSENNVPDAFVSENEPETLLTEIRNDVDEILKVGVDDTVREKSHGLDGKDQPAKGHDNQVHMQTYSSNEKNVDECIAPQLAQIHETLQDPTACNYREISASNNPVKVVKLSQNDSDVTGKHHDIVSAGLDSTNSEVLSVEKDNKVVNGIGDQLCREANICNDGNIKEVIHDNASNLFPADANGSGSLTRLYMHSDGHNETNIVKVAGSGALAQVKSEGLLTKDDKSFEENLGGGVNCVPASNGLAASDTISKVVSEQDIVGNSSVLSTDVSFEASISKKNAGSLSEHQSNFNDDQSLAKRAQEDSILKDARTIEAKFKRASEPPLRNFLLEKQRKSHWDYVLEEMAWLANDFMQERLWKITAASQLCHKIASNVQLKFEENLRQKQTSIARKVAKAVISFWQSAEEHKTLEGEELSKHLQRPIQCYAVRFLKSDTSLIENGVAEAPRTPDRLCDEGSLEVSRKDMHSEVSLFYNISLGSMVSYRQSVETHLLQNERMRTGTNQVDGEASLGDSAAEYKAYDSVMDEVEGEVMYGMPGVEGHRPSKSHKKRKYAQQKSGASRFYETGFDLPGMPTLEHKFGSQPQPLLVKRPPPVSNVGSIPTKRMRSAARRISPFVTNAAVAMQMTSKTDVSSGDTSSFQDDESSLHVSQKKNSEFESTVDFEKHNFDGSEVFTRPKKKKAKYLGYRNPLNSTTDCGDFAASRKSPSYDRKWPAESLSHLHQKDAFKGRLENHQLEYNGSSGLYAHPISKKLKIMKHLPENSPEVGVPNNGPIPSPVASQMSNMSNSTKLKVISNRDRVKKSKALKVASALSGPGGSWSLFEDQALVVLVHDMGPNWELISDAINSTLQFKYIFRTPKECKERHKILIDKTSGDGADSAEDSGCSTPYPSTLPGIPKGSARQLFQRLQGPMEEETLKSHFEKIILIGQRLHSHKNQKGAQDLKQVTPAHASHDFAVTQACPNNTAGAPLTPLDLCDTTSTDVLNLGYQGHNRIPNHQGPVAPMLPASTASPVVQGSPSMAYGNGFPSPSAALNTPAREMPRYAVPRPASLSVEDQQKLQYRHMLSGRASTGHLPIDRSARMLSPGNQIGLMGTINHGMPIPRPGFQTIGSPSMLNMVSSGSMLSPTGVGIANPVNMHPAAVPGQGGSMMRSREALQQMLRNSEDHRQMIIQDLQMQGTQGNGQSVAPFSGMTASLSNQTIPPVQTYSIQQQNPMAQGPQQPHMAGNPNLSHIQGNNHSNPQQQAFALRLVKDRQLQQRLFHQQPPFSASTAMPSLPNNPQLQHPSQSSSPPIPPISPSQSNVKQQALSRNSQTAGSVANPGVKQRPRQQQQPRQQSQQQQPDPAKTVKCAGRGNVLIAQNATIDAVHINGSPLSSGNQVIEKHMIPQNHALGTGSSSSTSTNQAPSQQKMYSRLPQSSKQMVLMPNQSGCHQGQVQPHSHQVPTTQQASVASSLPITSQPHQQRHANQPNQAIHRVMLHQNSQKITESSMQPAADCLPVNQMSKTLPQGHDPMSIIPDSSTVSISSSQSSFDSNPPSSAVHLANSPQPNLAGGIEPLAPPSSQGPQKQYSGTFSAHGVVGPRKQQQQHQLQKLQQQPQHQLHRQTGEGAYGRPSSSGPG